MLCFCACVDSGDHRPWSPLLAGTAPHLTHAEQHCHTRKYRFTQAQAKQRHTITAPIHSFARCQVNESLRALREFFENYSEFVPSTVPPHATVCSAIRPLTSSALLVLQIMDDEFGAIELIKSLIHGFVRPMAALLPAPTHTFTHAHMLVQTKSHTDTHPHTRTHTQSASLL